MDEEIINRVINGDSEAFRELIDRYKKSSFTIALGIVRNEEVAEEVVQDAFLNAYRGLPSFERKAKFSTWLYRIVYNQALKAIRKNKVQVVPMEDINWEYFSKEKVDNAMSGLLDEEQRFYIQKALNGLSQDQRTVINLFYLEENSLNEIKQITGMGLSNIKSLLHRGRKRFYKALEHELKNEVKAIL